MIDESPNPEERYIIEEDFSLGSARREDYIKVERLYRDLRDELQISEVFDNDGLSRAITGVEVNRPGLALAGFFDCEGCFEVAFASIRPTP